jgi:hypothetical protein
MALDKPSSLLTMDPAAPSVKQLVHKSVIAEALIIGFAAGDGDDVFEITAELPRLHGFYCDTGEDVELYDPVLLIEACRQSCFVVAHQGYGVHIGQKFILLSMEMNLTDHEGLARHNGPAHVAIRCHVRRQWHRADELTGMLFDFDVRINRRTTMSVAMSMKWVTEAQWHALRTRARRGFGLPVEARAPLCGERIAPQQVGRRVPANVVLGRLHRPVRGGYRAPLVVDTRHATLFDHPLDHLPAMLQLEGWRQLGIAALRRAHALAAGRAVLSSLSATFVRFAEIELDTSTGVELGDAAVDAGVGVRTSLRAVTRQAGDIVAKAEVGFLHVFE